MLDEYDKEKQTYPPETFQKFFNEQGKWGGQSMFIEQPQRNPDFPLLWTIKDYDTKGLPSAYKVYMDSVDEYEAAIKIAGTITNWEVLTKERSWFSKELHVWREHMAMRDVSLAKKQIIKNTKEGQTTAANSLKVWDKNTKKVGRRVKKGSAAADKTLALVKNFNPKRS